MTEPIKRILLTGGAGFVGSALTRRLVSDGYQVGVLDDFSRGRRDRLPEQCRTFNADIRDRAAVVGAIATYDTIIHLAYVQGTQTFYEHPKTVIDVALKGISNVLDGCETWGNKELILVSSSEAYQVPPPGYTPTAENVPLSVPDVTNPRYSYGAGKIVSEVAALAYRDLLKRVVIVRPHNVYGPDMGHEHVIPEFADRMQKITTDEFPIQGTGIETRCFCYIDDAVEGFMSLLMHGEHGEVYHLGNPEEMTITGLAKMIATHYGKIIRVKPGKLPQGSPPRRLPDITKLQGLGYMPKVHLKDGLVPTLAWYAKRELMDQAGIFASDGPSIT